MTVYSLLLQYKAIRFEREKQSKKFKDDIAYQRELAMREAEKKNSLMFGKRSSTNDCDVICKAFTSDLHLLVLTYTGFTRLLSDEKYY